MTSITPPGSSSPNFNGSVLLPIETNGHPPNSPEPLFPSMPVVDRKTSDELARAKALGIKHWMVAFLKKLPDLPPDLTSNAEPQKVETTHLTWNVTQVDFERKQLHCIATYSYINKVENGMLILDAKGLKIEKVSVNGASVIPQIIYSQLSSKPDALCIPIPSKKGLGGVSIRYTTSPDAKGIFWVDKEFTAGKKHPLVYTLFQPHAGASAIPGQHTPQVRLTYELHCNTGSPDLMALSSVSNNPKERTPSGQYNNLSMKRHVPLYLVSLHVGNLTFKPFDSRTGVYSEEVVIDEATKSLGILPEMMKHAEEICGPYNWGTYRPILLSWAFPYTAMEHPCASTCARICTERPGVFAHELSHSWTGNDTTNCNWREFFWNEGATTYLERQIMEKLWGTDYANMSFMFTLKGMQEAIGEFRESRPDVLRLCQDTDDFELCDIPYGKGALFFFMLKEALGHEDFDRFFKDYMKVFYQTTMCEARFLKFLEHWIFHEKKIGDFEQFCVDHKMNEWLHGIDIPSNAPKFTSKLMDAIYRERDKVKNNEPVDAEAIQKWDLLTQSNFLGQLVGHASAEQLAKLDSQMHFTASRTMSIRQEWARVCATAGYLTAETRNMITECVIERNSKNVANQIAIALRKTEEGRALIAHILEEDRGRLFPLTRAALL